MAHGGIEPEMRDCIENCLNCFSLCQETLNHCLMMGGDHAEAHHIRSLIDCAEACRTSAGFMLRGSPLHEHFCGACAQACEACEQDCRRMAGDDDLMQRCADMCRMCAESCKDMATRREHAQT